MMDHALDGELTPTPATSGWAMDRYKHHVSPCTPCQDPSVINVQRSFETLSGFLLASACYYCSLKCLSLSCLLYVLFFLLSPLAISLCAYHVPTVVTFSLNVHAYTTCVGGGEFVILGVAWVTSRLNQDTRHSSGYMLWIMLMWVGGKQSYCHMQHQ